MSNGGIRQRLILLTLLPTLLFLLAVIVYFGSHGLMQSRAEMQERGIMMARHLASIAEFSVTTGNMTTLRELVGSRLDDEVLAVRVFDLDNELVFSAGLTPGEGTPATTFPAETAQCGETDRLWLFCAPILFSPVSLVELDGGRENLGMRVVGRVELALTTERLQAQKVQTYANGAAVTFLLLVLLFFLITRVEQQIAHPLSELTRSVSLISDGASNVTIDANATGELRQLQIGFNRMAQTLDKHHMEMEQRITAATSKLSDAMMELEKRNLQLQHQSTLAQSASKAKSLFLATMSHEIRTPLSGIIGMLSLLDRNALPEQQRSYLEHLEQAATSLRMLIEDVLDFSRIEAGKLKINVQPFVPARSVEAVVMMLAHSAQQKRLELIVAIDPCVPEQMCGDELRFRQILINLLGNAIKFTGEGYVAVRVKTAERQPDRCRLRVEVEDSGIGIDPQKQQAIFEGFTQIDTSMTRQYGGSGLGTTISRELVRMMGGQIGVESTPGKGSCFWFELEPEVLNWPASAKPLAGQSYLLLERCGHAAEGLCNALHEGGAQVIWTRDGDELLRHAAEMAEGVVLLCENAPEFTWQEVAAELKKLRERGQVRTRHIHVTTIEGKSDPALFDGHLTKPLTVTRLQSALVTPSQRDDHAPQRMVQEHLRVLLAEDDRINATVVSRFITDLGHELELATDGKAARDALQHGEFDLVIMDLRMPEIDGLTVCREWRRLEQQRWPNGRRLPIVALTANASEEDRAECLGAGMDDFLTKPVSRDRLEEIMRFYAAKRDLTREWAT